MDVIKAVVKNGRIELNAPDDWPEGTEVLVEPLPQGEVIGLREEDWPGRPAEIARLLSRMDQIEPLDFTPEGEAEWEAARQARKEFEKGQFGERAEGLRRAWE